MLRKSLFLIIFLWALFFPLTSRAAYKYEIQFCQDANGNKRCDSGESIETKTASYEGLVPCGKCVKIEPRLPCRSIDIERCNCPPETVAPSFSINHIPCQFCHAFVMIKGILDFLLLPPTGIVFVLGVLMFVIGGAMAVYGNLMAPGNPKVIANAQKTMSAAVIGLVIIFGAWLFINALFTLIGVAEWTGLRGGWFTIDCPVQIPL